MEELLEFIDDSITEFHKHIKSAYKDKGFLNESQLGAFHDIFQSVELCKTRTTSIDEDPYLLDIADDGAEVPPEADA